MEPKHTRKKPPEGERRGSEYTRHGQSPAPPLVTVAKPGKLSCCGTQTWREGLVWKYQNKLDRKGCNMHLRNIVTTSFVGRVMLTKGTLKSRFPYLSGVFVWLRQCTTT